MTRCNNTPCLGKLHNKNYLITELVFQDHNRQNAVLFHDYLGPEKSKTEFHDFLGPVRTLACVFCHFYGRCI